MTITPDLHAELIAAIRKAHAGLRLQNIHLRETPLDGGVRYHFEVTILDAPKEGREGERPELPCPSTRPRQKREYVTSPEQREAAAERMRRMWAEGKLKRKEAV